MAQLARYIYRDFVTDRVPASGKNKPKKREIREWGTWIEGALLGTSVVGRVIHATRASLYADLAHAANTMAWVWNDPTTAYNGIYAKAGASGSGSWTRLTDLPYSFMAAQNDGDGTANAIEATTPSPVPDGIGRTLISLPIFVTNTNTPVTVEFNADGAPLTIKTSAGNDPVPGGLVAGMIVAGWKDGSTFRMLSDQASAAIQAAAEDAATQALAAAETVAAPKATVAAAVADDPVSDPAYYRVEAFDTNFTPGSGMLWLKHPTEPTIGAKFQNQNGAWYLPGGIPIVPESLGPVGSAAADTAAFLKAIEVCKTLGGGRYVMLLPREYQIDANVVIDADNVFVAGEARSVLRQINTLTGWMLSWYAPGGNIVGGGLLGVTLKGYAALASGGNAGVRFGALSGGIHRRASGWVARDVVIDGFAQYGMGVQDGDDWVVDNLRVLNHGFTAQNPGSCEAFYVWPNDQPNPSRGGRIRKVFAEISDASRDFGANSAACKLTGHVDLDAQDLVLRGGIEQVFAVNSLERLRLSDVHVIHTNNQPTYAGRPGMTCRSREVVTNYAASRMSLKNIHLSRASGATSIYGLMLGAGSPGMSEATLENVTIEGLYQPALAIAQLNYSVMKACRIRGVAAGLQMFFTGTSILPHSTLRHENNDIDLDLLAGGAAADGYEGNDSDLSIRQHRGANTGWRSFTAGGTPNRYHDCVFGRSSGIALQINGSDVFYRPRFVSATTRSVLFGVSSSGARVVDPEGLHVGTGPQASGTGNQIAFSLDSFSVINSDVALTIGPGVSETTTVGGNRRHIRHTGTLTADRAVVLSTLGVSDGYTIRITRTGSGAFNLLVGAGPLKALATNTWCEVTYSASAAAWFLSAYGAL